MRGNKFLAGVLSAAMVLSTMTVPIFAEGVISEQGTGVEVKSGEGTSEGVITESVEETTKNETSTEGETAGEKATEAATEGEALESTLKETPNEEKLTEAVNSVNAVLTNEENTEETAELTREETTTVAKIGDVGYTSLADAVKAVNNGDTIKLLSDITLISSIDMMEDEAITLDMNGKTITFNGGQINLKGSDLIVEGDGAFDVKLEKDTNGNYKSGSICAIEVEFIESILTINSLTIDGASNNGLFIASRGSIVINGGTYEMIDGGAVIFAFGSASSVEINDGKFISKSGSKGGEGAVYAFNGANITVKGGTFNMSDVTEWKISNVNYTFCDYSCYIGFPDFKYGSVDVTSKGKFLVQGGTYSCDISSLTQPKWDGNAPSESNQTPFTKESFNYLADGKMLNKNLNGTYTVVDVAAKLDNTNVTTEEKVETLNNVVVSSAVADKVVETIKALPTEAKEEISAAKLEEIIEAKKAAASTSGSGAGQQEGTPTSTSVVITTAAEATSSTSDGGGESKNKNKTSLNVTALKSKQFDKIEVKAITAVDKTSGGSTESGSSESTTNIKLPEGTDAVYFDITLTKTNSGGGGTTTVTEVETPILLKFTVPDASKVKSVLRYHDGVQEAIPFEKGENNTIMVSAVKFSEYAVVNGATPESGEAVLTFIDGDDGDGKCEIYLVGASDDDVKYFESGEFKIVDTASLDSSQNNENIQTSGKVAIEIEGAKDSKGNAILTIDEVANGYYKIHRPSGATEYPAVDTSNHRILLGTLTLAGTGKGQIYAKNIKMWKKSDNDSQVVEIKTTSDYVTYDIKSKTETLTVDVTFPNAIEKQVSAYQDMKITISGGDLSSDIVYKLGSDASSDVSWTASDTSAAKYTLTLKDKLTKNISYTVKVEGAGYRTARYIVNMSDAKTLTFWNNVKTTGTVIETGKTTPTVTTNFLAGDIVKDNQINIYDLSAVVSYFGEENLIVPENIAQSKTAYAKYDLNRDGKIDSKDIAYVLVSWGN